MRAYLVKSWYVGVFLAVMGFAAGTAMEGDCQWVMPAIRAAGGMEGGQLMLLACQSALLNGMLWLVTYAFRDCSLRGIVTFSAAWLKMMMAGLCCGGMLHSEVSVGGVLLCAMTVFGSSSICASLMIKDGIVSTDGNRIKLYLWLTGVLIEGVMVTSVAKSIYLLT